ncbi:MULTISPECIES: transcriptional regulator [Klebsiella]|uniref:transcriptional regulator n=1 Tax=Klebsiella TaxID=570 RepID=UPI0007CBEB06|nr:MULTISPECIES: YdaS family helix-turn-helix protein [Klebsiella]DAW20849.1 MAG TPA: Putative antitoxin of bacterial toxin-antitoxin system, YdaS/YdaT [Caudoviricetes sp.]MDH0491061.1 helix-turn-helix domain-containing protein [Klebsiella michiganensis]MDS7913027.1 YdaS family helix-turn-helix protein [Klebsiella pasteurii]MDU4160501.1 YdaS family helix-turn-helix protein [Klebsiella michiganensis]MDV0373915.1 YdaS family helix-turn-helix protein [Klebsiella michiganensis]
MKALDKAINIAGNASKLAESLDVSAMTVSHWKNRNCGVVPQSRVLPIFKATGVTPHELRPDIYPNPTDGFPAVGCVPTEKIKQHQKDYHQCKTQ